MEHGLVLIRSDESLSLEDKEWYLEWASKTSGGVRLAHTHGTHANLLKKGYVDGLASRLRWAFHEASDVPPDAMEGVGGGSGPRTSR